MKKLLSALLIAVTLLSVAAVAIPSVAAATLSEQETNDDQASATPVKVNQTFTGTVSETWDKDCYQVTAPADGTLIVRFSHDFITDTVHAKGWAIAVDELVNNYSVNVGYRHVYQNENGTYEVWRADVKKGKTYYVSVYALKNTGIVGVKYAVSCGFILPKLTNAAFTSDTASVRLSWDKASQASGYQIRIRSNGKWQDYAKTTANTYTAKSLKSGTAYNFAVRSYHTAGGATCYSNWSYIYGATKPQTPAVYNPKTDSVHRINAIWKATTCSGYYVQLSTDKSFRKNVVTEKIAGKTNFIFNRLKKGTQYYIRVRAFKTCADKRLTYSAWSTVKSIRCK